MESWLPWLVDPKSWSPTCLGDDALVVLVEPRRVRDRAGELADEESALADALATTWGLEAGDGRPPSARPLRPAAGRHRRRPRLAGPLGRRSRHPRHREPGVGAHPGDGAKLAAQVSHADRRGLRGGALLVHTGGADRLSGILAEEGVIVPVAVPGGSAGSYRVDQAAST